jgi:hypothetical protein
MTGLEIAPEGERELIELEPTIALLLTLNGTQGAHFPPRGIRFRWSPEAAGKIAGNPDMISALTTWREL